MGCFVAADSCEMTVVDRVFTRIGASDRILENKSTFFVELEETKAILDMATKNSLVIMDELGRGTSTYDGYAIAHAVLAYLSQKIKCRTMFTTHYHRLVDDFSASPGIELFTMASEVQHDNHTNKLKFLYKFQRGASKQSFGIFIAQLAGIDSQIIEKAKQKAIEFNH
jgi:DNA mismatch repair protein MSH6